MVYVDVDAFLIDDNQGIFTNDDGKEIEYHKARFYDTYDNKVFKVSVPKDTILPKNGEDSVITLEINLGEKFNRINYCSFKPKGK